MKKRLLLIVLSVVLLVGSITPTNAQDYLQIAPSLFFGTLNVPFESGAAYANSVIVNNNNSFALFIPFSMHEFSGSALIQLTFTFGFLDYTGSGLETYPQALYSDYIDVSHYGRKSDFNIDTSGSIPNNTYVKLDDTCELYCKRTITSTGMSTNNVIGYSLTFIISENFSHNDLYLDFYVDNLQFNSNSSSSFWISSAESSVVLVNASYGDLQSAVNGIASNTSGISAGLADIGNNISAGNDILKNDVVNSIDDVQSSVDYLHSRMPDLVESGTQSALESHDDDLYKENMDGLDDNVNKIVEKIPLVSEINGASDVLESVYDLVSSDSTDCSVRFPAGDVSIAGKSYHFWDETYVDLNPVFSNEHITLLLVALRFSFGVAFLWSCVNWCNKIISLVLMEDTANVHMEMQRANVDDYNSMSNYGSKRLNNSSWKKLSTNSRRRRFTSRR